MEPNPYAPPRALDRRADEDAAIRPASRWAWLRYVLVVVTALYGVPLAIGGVLMLVAWAVLIGRYGFGGPGTDAEVKARMTRDVVFLLAGVLLEGSGVLAILSIPAWLRRRWRRASILLILWLLLLILPMLVIGLFG
jgi:hypothetical protein